MGTISMYDRNFNLTFLQISQDPPEFIYLARYLKFEDIRLNKIMQYFTKRFLRVFIFIFLCMPIFCWAGSPVSLSDQAKSNELKDVPSSTNLMAEKISKSPNPNKSSTPSNYNLRPWWLGDLLNIFGIIIGILIVVYQLGKQRRNELTVQKENHREQFRIQIYQEFSKLLGIAVEKNSHSKMYAFNLPMHVHNYRDQNKKGFSPAPLRERVMEFNKRHFDSLRSDNDLISLIERYQIVDPKLDIFLTAISVAHYDMTETFNALFPFLFEILPHEIPLPNGSYHLVNVISPSDEQVSELEKFIDAYVAASDETGCYLYDLNVELQNTLLIGLFPNKAPRRVPLDPKFKVISTEPNEMENLRKYFEEETDWGKNNRQTELDVLSTLP